MEPRGLVSYCHGSENWNTTLNYTYGPRGGGGGGNVQVPYLNKKFWEELIAYFPLIRQGPHKKLRLQ
jgi:hypothetical protein